MISTILVGAIQGLLEWLPISSEGFVTLILTNLGYSLQQSVDLALFLHLGTLFAAISYFRKDLKEIINPKTRKDINKLLFVIWASVISGIIGMPLYFLFTSLSNSLSDSIGQIFIGFFLFITGTFQLLRKDINIRKVSSVNSKDGIITGIAQGFSALPGISRSGITTLVLNIRDFKVSDALKLSFIVGIIPIFGITLVTGIRNGFYFSLEHLLGALSAFIIGRLTIDYFLKLVRKVNFGNFCIIFGVVNILIGACM